MSALTPLSLEDYDAIASAVMETERGRWFLAEFARRNRAADTAAVLEALSALEGRIGSRQAEPAGSAEAVARIRAAAELAAAVRENLASMQKPRRQVVKAIRQCGEVERAVALALEALGAQPEPLRIAAAVETAAEDDFDGAGDEVVIAAQPEAEPRTEIEAEPEPEREPEPLHASLEEPAAAPHDDPAPELEADDASWEDEPRFPRAVMLVNGETFDLTEEPAAPPLAAAPEPVAPAPRAWTPGLLESLTEDEKAVLFA